MNGSALLAIATGNPKIVAELLHVIDPAVQADPGVLTDVAHVVDGSLTLLGFATKHPALVARLTGIIVADPDLLVRIMAAVES